MAKGKFASTSQFPEHQLISVNEMQDREQKQMQRLQDVSVSCGYMKVALEEFAWLEKQRAKREHWEHHLRCDGLPRPYIPPEIRTFLFRQRHFQNILEDDTVDWTLSVDERSILTQNIFRKDNTRRHLAEIMNDKIGERIEEHVELYINTLSQIDKMLGNQAEMERLTFEHQMEIMESRTDIEKEIENSFDYLTYRIIRMDGIYMVSTDARVATWNYSCDLFKIDIWSLRDVSIRFDHLEVPAMMADLISSGVRVQMPLSVLRDRLTLRCVYTKFDKLSQNAKGYERVTLQNISYLNAGIMDIEDSLINEWYMQLDIQQELLDKINRKWEEYEEIMEMIAEKTERAAKDQRIKHHHIPKPPKEPPQLLPGMLPDPLTLFLDKEEYQYLDFLDDMYHPKKLNLTMDEINLREHIMLGGIYSIMFVRRPQHKHFEKFNITLHEDGRILYTITNESVKLDDRRKSSRSAGSMLKDRSSTTYGDRRQSYINQVPVNLDEEYSTFHLDENELPYFIISIKLPQELCYWSEPVPCQYMISNQVTNISSTSIIPEMYDSPPKVKKHKNYPEPSRFSSKLHDERISMIQRKDSEPINIFRPTLISILRHTKLMQPVENVVPFENFVLNDQLKNLKLRKLEQFLLPRIISSFKFPIDIKEEKEQQLDQRGKAQKGLLRLNDPMTESNIQEAEVNFEYESQHNPERMFPIYPGDGPVIFPDDVSTSELTEKNTAYGLLNTIENIKMKYMYKYRNISAQTDFDIKRSIMKKKLDDKDKIVDKLILKEKTVKKKQMKSKPIKTISNLITSKVPNTVSASISQSQNSYVDLDHSSIHSVASVRLIREQSTSDIEKDKPVTENVLHWTTRYIFESKFDRKDGILTIKTDRLGIFGLAFKRYEHFPFQDWSLQPNDENPEEIILRLDTFHVRVILYISSRGIRGYVTDITKVYSSKPNKYLEIIEPITDFHELRQRFWDKNINIFAENDASFYINNGYFTIKHVAMEHHIYDAMALHCKLMKFYRSSWNRLATRRNILICMKNSKDSTEYSEVTVRLTPINATFVEVSETCSNNLNVFNLEYKPTWRNIGTFTDLHQIINSMNPHATEVRNRDSMLLYLLKKLLSELRILSFS